MDTQLVLVHIHHCLLVQQFNIQLQHSANPLLPVNDEQDICNPTVNIILQLKCQLRSLSTYYQLQLHQYPLQVNFNFNINFHLNIKFHAKWMSDGHLTSMIVKLIFESIHRNSRILHASDTSLLHDSLKFEYMARALIIKFHIPHSISFRSTARKMFKL